MGQMRFGVHAPLEEEADRFINQSIKAGGHAHSAKADILTPAKEQHRRRHEIFVASGTPDPSVRSGMYHRAANRAMPHLNSRGGVTPPAPRGSDATHGISTSSLAEFVQTHFLS